MSVSALLSPQPLHMTSHLLKHVLSTITSPTFSEVILVYRDYDFSDFLDARSPRYKATQGDRARETLRRRETFKIFRWIHKVRHFQLVLCADVWYRLREHAMRMLKGVVAAEKAEAGFGFSFPEPFVIYSPRESQTDLTDDLCARGTRTPM